MRALKITQLYFVNVAIKTLKAVLRHIINRFRMGGLEKIIAKMAITKITIMS